MKFLLSILLSILSYGLSFAQIGIGTATPDSSAQLEVYSTSKGFLPPRMSTQQRKAIAKPAIGLMVFDTDKNTLFLYDGAKWASIGTFAEKDITPFTRDVAASQVNDHLGFCVAMDSNYAVVGAPLDSSTAGKQGAAYFLKKDPATGWQVQAKVVASDAAAGDYFGYCVSIKGAYAVIGTYASSGPGAAYIFSRNGDTWTQQTKLTASDGSSGDQFGAAVSLYDADVVIGAPMDDVDSLNCGSVYVFSRTGSSWTEQAKLVAPDKKTNDHFGKTVSLYGNKLLVGAPDDYVPPTYEYGTDFFSGSAYPWIKNGNSWTALRKIRESRILGATYQGNFGTAISNAGSRAVITDYGGDMAFTYSFADTGLVYESALNTSSSTSLVGYGRSAWISGDYMVIGVVVRLPPGISQAGSVLCYKRSGTSWSLIKTINKVDASTSNFTLGRSVAMDANLLDILIGAPGNSSGSEINQNVTVKGSFYISNLQ